MRRAVWNGVVLAESDDTVMVEGRHYFPRESIRWEYLRESPTHTTCWWKGRASYYSLVVDDRTNPDAAWCYPEPSAAASKIEGRVAFWHGVKIVQVHGGSDTPPSRRSWWSRVRGVMARSGDGEVPPR